VRGAVPYYPGKASGLDFEPSIQMKVNQENFFKINTESMAQAEKLIGKPDFTISDYEPISAQYAYAWNAPLVTVDQQSKFLVGKFPPSIEGCFYEDEVMRLRLFFPKATLRIACSFFSVDSDGEVIIVPPIIRNSIYNLKRKPQNGQVLVYFSAQQFKQQPLEKLLELFAKFPDFHFHLFAPEKLELQSKNITLYKHGDTKFDELLERCEGIISTAGHSLLSEAMAIGIPVLALPIRIYEQQINGLVIGKNKFGLCAQILTNETLKEFLNNIPRFTQNIAQDQTVLLKGNGLQQILKLLEPHLHSLRFLGVPSGS
jgi:uncharacterized protein (TIGR00661 family)